ncbi:MAG TPA: hypothetical protein VKP13_08210 [Nitrospira sp.]|nr:hypothetical protein [Nitrospira sp.]
MKKMKRLLWSALVILGSVFSTAASATDYVHSTPGLSGYDPVAYFTDGMAMRGSGFHEATY